MQNRGIEISIITASYNSADTIRTTMESVLRQTHPPVEYIIVDGASSDDTMDIVKGMQAEFDTRGIDLRWISEPDRGMYDAMNKGIHMARGDVIGLLNSDDFYEDDALERVSEAFPREPESDIVMGAIRIYNGGTSFIKYARDRRYRTSRDFNHPAMFVTADCYSRIGDYGIGNVHDDYGWFLKAMKQGAVLTVIRDVLTHYTTGGAGSVKSLRNTLGRIGPKYKVYRENGYSRLYLIECIAQELGKYVLLRS